MRTPRSALAGAALFAALAGAGCNPPQKRSDIRLWGDDIALRVSTDPAPPVAREKVVYRVIVRDKESGQPIEGGEGRIFAESRDGAKTWNALLAGPEPGSYYGTLNYITAGDWAIAIQFRRDSLSRIQRVDWMQGVRAPAQDFGGTP